MKIVLDTNVFVSGIFWGGVPAKILSLWQHKKITLCLTPIILQEYERITELLSEEYPDVDVQSFRELISMQDKIFPDIVLPEPVCRDKDDDKFIACALSAGARYIVTGDKDLLVLETYHHIDIVTPKNFLQEFQH